MLNKNICTLVLITALFAAAHASAGFITTQNPEWGSTEDYFGIRVVPNSTDGTPLAVLTKYNANGTINEEWSTKGYDTQIASAITAAIPKVLPQLDDALAKVRTNSLPANYDSLTPMERIAASALVSLNFKSFQFGLNLTLADDTVTATLGLNRIDAFTVGSASWDLGVEKHDYYSADHNATIWNYAVNAMLGGSSTLATFSQEIPADIAAKLLALGSEFGDYTNTMGYDTGHGVLNSVAYDGNGSLDALVSLTVDDLQTFSNLAHRWMDGGFTEGYTYEYYAGTGETATPEPATMLILGLGIAGLGLARRRRRK
jgi:hypothetical protein